MILNVDPKVDYAFKRVFGREANEPILINLLDSVLCPAPGHEIRHLELLNPFNEKETLDDKLSILDIKARDQSGRQFNIEMQMVAYPHYEKRILYYAAKLHQQQLHAGQDYLEMKPTISISFLNHVWFDNLADYHLCFRLLEEKHQIPLADDLQVHILELPKFKKSPEELKNSLDIWLYFLRNAEKMNTDEVPVTMRQPLLMRALEELQVLTKDDIERERYEARLKAQSDHSALMKAALLERTEGRAQGLAEGRAEGRADGRAEGERIGVIHLCERVLNRPETPIEKLASLSLDELTRLAEQLQAQALKRNGS